MNRANIEQDLRVAVRTLDRLTDPHLSVLRIRRYHIANLRLLRRRHSRVACAARGSRPSLLTLLTSGDAGDATSESSGVGTNNRLSERGSLSRGFIQASAARSASTTGIRLYIDATAAFGSHVIIVNACRPESVRGVIRRGFRDGIESQQVRLLLHPLPALPSRALCSATTLSRAIRAYRVSPV
jgi:hypothetical protein